MAYYVNLYQIGWAVEEANGPSLQRWPISHGPFKTEQEAYDYAEAAFGGEE